MSEAKMYTTSFEIHDDAVDKSDRVRVEARDDRGPFETWKWCVSRGNNVLNSDNEWEWEPLPSSRDEDFLKRTRFALQEAQQRAMSIHMEKRNA